MHLTKENRVAAQFLADWLHVERDDLLLVLEVGPEYFYAPYDKPKHDGGFRVIYPPLEPLDRIQKAINRRLLREMAVSSIAHAFVRGRSIESCAYPHFKSHSMFAVDLKNAYDYTSFKNIFFDKDAVLAHSTWTRGGYYHYPNKLWEELGIKRTFAEFVRYLVDLTEPSGYHFLPQGAPTSPALFNRACRELDRRLERLASNVGGVVTRYADNIVFSWEQETIDREIRQAIKGIVGDCRFVLNPKKTLYICNGNRQGVPLRLPGINIMDGEFYIPRKQLRHFRMAMYCALKAGRMEKYYGYKGAALQAVSMLPPQLRGLYNKAVESDYL